MKKLIVVLVLGIMALVSANVFASGVRHHHRHYTKKPTRHLKKRKQVRRKKAAIPSHRHSAKKPTRHLKKRKQVRRKKAVISKPPMKVIPKPPKRKSLYFYTQADIGAAIGKIGKSQHIMAQGSFFDDYQNTSKYKAAAVYGLHLGVGFKPVHPLFVELGVGVYGTSSFTGNVHVIEFANFPGRQDNSFDAGYNVRMYRVMAEGKIFFQDKTPFVPYVTAGVGGSWILADHFHVIATQGATGGDEYEARTTTALAWQVGCGVDVLLYKDLGINIGYRYVDHGTGEMVDSSGKKFSTGPIITHDIVLGISYLV